MRRQEIRCGQLALSEVRAILVKRMRLSLIILSCSIVFSARTGLAQSAQPGAAVAPGSSVDLNLQVGDKHGLLQQRLTDLQLRRADIDLAGPLIGLIGGNAVFVTGFSLGLYGAFSCADSSGCNKGWLVAGGVTSLVGVGAGIWGTVALILRADERSELDKEIKDVKRHLPYVSAPSISVGPREVMLSFRY